MNKKDLTTHIAPLIDQAITYLQTRMHEERTCMGEPKFTDAEMRAIEELLSLLSAHHLHMRGKCIAASQLINPPF